MKRQTVIFFLCSIVAFFFWKQGFQIFDSTVSGLKSEVVTPLPLSAPEPVKQDALLVIVEKPVVMPVKILQEVPFTLQAPTGNWKDLVFQNACEEAALLMVDKWVRGSVFGTLKETEGEIQKITQAEKTYFPKNSYDLSAQDTLVLAQKYFPDMRISLVENVTKDDIKNTVSEGKIIIIPANGQKLRNPNFTAPGPLYHMLLIRGYDPATDEFVANDPGTRKGNAYRYAAGILFDAMQNYETGYHGKMFPDEKVMLVVEK